MSFIVKKLQNLVLELAHYRGSGFQFHFTDWYLPVPTVQFRRNRSFCHQRDTYRVIGQYVGRFHPFIGHEGP
jgi:hypothetical protein